MERMNFQQLFESTCYSEKDRAEGVDLILSMVKWVPHERISAKDAMNHPFLRDTLI